MRFSPWKIGKYTRWASCWDQYSWVSAIPEDCHLCTEISKRWTIMQATALYVWFLDLFELDPLFGLGLGAIQNRCHLKIKISKGFSVMLIFIHSSFGVPQNLLETRHLLDVQSNLAIRNGLKRNKLVLKNHFLWPICHLFHKDKELLALRNNFRANKKFLIAKFDCTSKIVQVSQIKKTN